MPEGNINLEHFTKNQLVELGCGASYVEYGLVQKVGNNAFLMPNDAKGKPWVMVVHAPFGAVKPAFGPTIGASKRRFRCTCKAYVDRRIMCRHICAAAQVQGAISIPAAARAIRKNARKAWLADMVANARNEHRVVVSHLHKGKASAEVMNLAFKMTKEALAKYAPSAPAAVVSTPAQVAALDESKVVVDKGKLAGVLAWLAAAGIGAEVRLEAPANITPPLIPTGVPLSVPVDPVEPPDLCQPMEPCVPPNFSMKV